MFSKSTKNRICAAAVGALMCVSLTGVVAVPLMTMAPITASAAATKIGVTLEERPEDAADSDKTGVYRGKTCALASSGIKTITFTCIPENSGSFVWGFGINLDKDPWWKDGFEGKVASVTAGEEFTVTVDVSKLSLGYNPVSSEWASEYEFRNYYCNGGTVKVVSAEANAKVTEPTEKPTEATEEPTEDQPVKPGPSSGGGWKFTDNGDGTGTIVASLSRQIDFFDDPYVLTKGYDEEYYAEEGVRWVEGEDPINSHKFSYSTFGLSGIGPTGGVIIDGLTATIQSSVPVKTFMYGGGMNVVNESPADTEAAKAAAGKATTDDAGYWYNDMGEEVLEELEADGVEFGIEPGTGVTLKSSGSTSLGEYFSVDWEVPEGVKPYETGGELSFQFWYGEEDAKEYKELESVELVSGKLNYTQTKTFDYTDVATFVVGDEVEAGDTSGTISFKDAGVPVGAGQESTVHAVVFHVTAPSALDKLVYAVGASVGEKDFKMWADAEKGDKWNFVATPGDAEDIQLVWIAPDGVDLNEEYGNIQFGYWYGDADGDEINSVTLESIDIYYDTKEAATEAPTEKPTEAPTEKPTEAPTEAELKVTKYGDVDVDGDVDIVDVITLNKNLMIGEKITDQGKVNADVDNNKTIDEVDSLNILKFVVELIDLPV
ncbi:MAG: DUF5620 domain-containing protein [Oscillospiraceae bacterium]|nr:DUF5620 domain-containing protein [Oscillospiraceae bacterium]